MKRMLYGLASLAALVLLLVPDGGSQPQRSLPNQTSR